MSKAVKKAKLNTRERATLKNLLDRVAQGRTLDGDIKKLTNRIWEARCNGDDRIFRLLYARTKGGTQVLLELTFFVKKQQRTPKNEISKATKRLNDWEQRHP